MHSSDDVAMRPESFNLPTTRLSHSQFVLFDFFSLSHSLVFPNNKNALLEQSARHMCVQRRAISMLGRLKDYLNVPRSRFFGNCLLITKYRC